MTKKLRNYLVAVGSSIQVDDIENGLFFVGAIYIIAKKAIPGVAS